MGKKIKPIFDCCEMCGCEITHHHRLCDNCHRDRQKREAREKRNRTKLKVKHVRFKHRINRLLSKK